MNIKDKAYYALNKFYGYKSFREGQLEVIEKIAFNKDVFCLLPTGGGKSVCYQIPSIILDGVTIVISPLISLMKDQVDNLRELGIKGTFINSSLSNERIKEILKDAMFGEYKIIYISATQLTVFEFLNSLCKGLGLDVGNCYRNDVENKINDYFFK